MNSFISLVQSNFISKTLYILNLLTTWGWIHEIQNSNILTNTCS